jgi:hypothetical protein
MNWANGAGFPKVPPGRQAPGLDLVIGHGARPQIDCPKVWGADFAKPNEHAVVDPIPQSVTMRGGEYFYMPSLAFLQSLGAGSA